MPKSKVEFWQNKFEANQKRDFVVRNELLEKNLAHIIRIKEEYKTNL